MRHTLWIPLLLLAVIGGTLGFVAVGVTLSSMTRAMRGGEVMLRIEPTTDGRRAMTWKELDPTDPTEDDKFEKKTQARKSEPRADSS